MLRTAVLTLAFAALYVPLTVILSMLIAMGLNRPIKGIGWFRVMFFLPAVCSPTATGLPRIEGSSRCSTLA